MVEEKRFYKTLTLEHLRKKKKKRNKAQCPPGPLLLYIGSVPCCRGDRWVRGFCQTRASASSLSQVSVNLPVTVCKGGWVWLAFLFPSLPSLLLSLPSSTVLHTHQPHKAHVRASAQL